MHTFTQVATLLMTLGLGRSFKLDGFGQSRCCSNSLSPTPRQPQNWVATLREATYRSITRHLDYSGTLDGRLDRDHTLWKLLQQASYSPNHSQSPSESDAGVLLEKLHNNQVAFEFRQMDKSLFECTPSQCDPKNDSVVAIWRVRRSDDPFAMWIQVKLPKIKDHPTEDVYEYSNAHGLKKLNPDPLHNSLSYEKPHRFSSPKGKSSFRSEARMDIPFGSVFGIGRVTPTSFIYDPPLVSGKSEDGWIIAHPRRPHPAVVLDTGTKSVNVGSPYNPNSHFTVSGPKGYHHVIHSLPSIPPPQNLDHPSHNIGGFLPSVGPVNAPPVYQLNHVYDPRYVVYYNRPDHPPKLTTQPPRQFKPSTEFIHYSEVDPFYHPNGEQDMLSTTPMPFKNFYSTGFPQSINEQLPTNSPIENTRPPFQIIVGDVKSSHRTTTRKPTSFNKPLTTETPKNRFISRQRTTTTERPGIEEFRVTTKPFGEKIRPKTSPPIYQTTTRTREKLTTKPFQENKKKISTSNTDKKNKVRINTRPKILAKQPSNSRTTNKVETINTSIIQNYATISTQPIESTETTEAIAVSTTEESETKTTNLDTETIEEFTGNTKPYEISIGITDEKPKMVNTSLTTTQSSDLHPMGITESVLKTEKPENEATTEGYLNDGTTEANNETTTDTKSSGMDDFLSTLTDTLFSMQTTTENNEETTIVITQKAVDNMDADTQESQQHNYRLVTFPGDTVSIVSNRISKSVSYRTAGGKEGQLKTKKRPESRYRFSDAYKDYSTIL